MSSVRQRVLRTVRLLPQAVKIGMESEAALPLEQGEEQRSNGEDGIGVAEALASGEPVRDENRELLDRIEELSRRLNDAERRSEELAREKAEAEAGRERLREEYAEKERALEARVLGESERAREEGRLRGEAEGREAGHVEGLRTAKVEVEALYLKKLGGLVSLLESMGTRLEAEFSELVALNQPRMLRLWFDLLERMLKREVELKPDALLPVLSDVLTRLSDKNSVVIYVSPEDLELLRSNLDQEFEEVLRGVRHLELKPDTNVDRGSCIVETGLGVYDARWRTQIEQVESVIEKLFQKLGKPAKPAKQKKRPSAQKKDKKDDAPKKRAKEDEEEGASSPEPAEGTRKKRAGGRKAAAPKAVSPEAAELEALEAEASE